MSQKVRSLFKKSPPVEEKQKTLPKVTLKITKLIKAIDSKRSGERNESKLKEEVVIKEREEYEKKIPKGLGNLDLSSSKLYEILENDDSKLKLVNDKLFGGAESKILKSVKSLVKKDDKKFVSEFTKKFSKVEDENSVAELCELYFHLLQSKFPEGLIPSNILEKLKVAIKGEYRNILFPFCVCEEDPIKKILHELPDANKFGLANLIVMTTKILSSDSAAAKQPLSHLLSQIFPILLDSKIEKVTDEMKVTVSIIFSVLMKKCLDYNHRPFLPNFKEQLLSEKSKFSSCILKIKSQSTFISDKVKRTRRYKIPPEELEIFYAVSCRIYDEYVAKQGDVFINSLKKTTGPIKETIKKLTDGELGFSNFPFEKLNHEELARIYKIIVSNVFKDGVIPVGSFENLSELCNEYYDERGKIIIRKLESAANELEANIINKLNPLNIFCLADVIHLAHLHCKKQMEKDKKYNFENALSDAESLMGIMILPYPGFKTEEEQKEYAKQRKRVLRLIFQSLWKKYLDFEAEEIEVAEKKPSKKSKKKE